MNTALLDSIVKGVGDAYATFDSMQISVTALLIGLVVFSFGFFFALREAASWFLKIDDVKKDVRRLRDLVLDMEGELHSLQAQMAKNKTASDLSPAVHTPEVSAQVATQASVAAAAKAASFRITH